MVMKLQMFMIKKSQRWALIILDYTLVITLDSALKKDDNHYPKVFLKECKYVEKKVVRHIHDNLSNFSSDDESDEE